MHIEIVAKYPEYGFAVLEDDEGKFLMFKDSDKLEPVESILALLGIQTKPEIVELHA